jgi:23S rRNA pseudouridine955/2504/2580 synthase
MGGVDLRQVAPGDDGIRLDRWFKRHFPDLAHGRLEKLLRTGQVRVDGARAKSADRLAAGQTIRVPPLGAPKPDDPDRPTHLPPKTLSAADRAFIRAMVVLETEDAWVLNKPAGLAVQGGTNTTRHVDGMLDGLAGRGDDRPKLVHRLDKDTSGVLLLARSARAADLLSKAFQSRSAEKVYWAITVGVPRPHAGTIDLALAKLPGRGPDGAHERMVAVDEDDDDAKRAVTDYKVLAYAGKSVALVALRPRTGRTHQLRAHMAAINTPILGDGKYGGADARIEGAPSSRLHLHARALRIAASQIGAIEVEAAPPDMFLETVRFFGLEDGMSGDPFDAFHDAPDR